MTRLTVAAAACLGMLLTGYDYAFAGRLDGNFQETQVSVAKVQTVPLTTTKSSSGYAMPEFSSNPYSHLISQYARQYGVPVNLAHAIVRVESNFNPKARGGSGEIGLMQIKPSTARMMGYSGSAKGLYDPETNIKFGMKYLAAAHQLGGGKTCGTVLKYNAGHAATRMNPVSKRYCGKVMDLIG